MIEIKFNIRNFIEKRTNRVIVRVRWQNKAYEVGFTTGLYAQASKWDPDQQKAKRGTTHEVRDSRLSASEINACLARFHEVICDCFARCSLANAIPTPEELKVMVNKEIGRKKAPISPTVVQKRSFKELFEEFLESEGRVRNWDAKCKAKYIQAYNHLTAAIPGITPETITLDDMYTLRQWYADNGYVNFTVIKQNRILKCFLKWINKQDGYSIPQEIFDYKTKLKTIKRTVTFLHYDELMTLYNFKFEEKDGRLDKARDLWCFMAFTSLRYSDLRQLRLANIIDGNRIDLVTQKTCDRISIPLIDPALDLINKYKDRANDTLFDVPSNQKLNDYIKEAAKIAGIDRVIVDDYFIGTKRKQETHKFYEIISCHDARRTFVSCSLAMGIPPQVVMKCTGHKGYETMKPYIETAIETQQLEMEKWNRTHYKAQIIQYLDKASEERLKDIIAYISSNLVEKQIV